MAVATATVKAVANPVKVVTVVKPKTATKKDTGKKPTKPEVKVDGRANPAAFDRAKFDTGVPAQKIPKKFAELRFSTPIKHQNGKGTRGQRDSFELPSGMRMAKTAIVRWCGAAGLSREQAATVLAAWYLPMTGAVLAKSYAMGVNLTLDTTKEGKAALAAELTIDAADAKAIKAAAK